MGLPIWMVPTFCEVVGRSTTTIYEGWELPRIQERGRWGSLESVQHYRKPHLLVKNEGRATEEQDARGRWLWEDVSRFGLAMPIPKVDSLFPDPNVMTLEPAPNSHSDTSDAINLHP